MPRDFYREGLLRQQQAGLSPELATSTAEKELLTRLSELQSRLLQLETALADLEDDLALDVMLLGEANPGTSGRWSSSLTATDTAEINFATSGTTATWALIDGSVVAGRMASGMLTALIDAQIGSTRGAVLYRGASGWAKLDPGAAGLKLQTNGAGADPTWA